MFICLASTALVIKHMFPQTTKKQKKGGVPRIGCNEKVRFIATNP